MTQSGNSRHPISIRGLRRKIGSWDNLTALEAAVRLESFTKAAAELGISQPAISRRIIDLEERLGVALFERNGKRLKVTDAGLELQNALARAFVDIDHQLERTMRARPAEGVTLRITPSASGWILPALGPLCNAFPEIPVNLVCLDFRADPSATEYDLQLCFMAGAQPNSFNRLLLPGEVLQVASPEFVARSDAEFLKCPLLQMEKPFTESLDWRAWYPDEVDRMDIRLQATYAEALEGAIAGRGVALGWRYSIGPHIRAGRLVRINREVQKSEFGEYLIASPLRSHDPSVAKIANWLSDYAERIQKMYCDI